MSRSIKRLSVANEPIMLSVIMLSVIMLNVIMLSVIMLSVIILSVSMLSVIMMSVNMLSVEMTKVVKASIVMTVMCHGRQHFHFDFPDKLCQCKYGFSKWTKKLLMVQFFSLTRGG
jgi:hypothetical protein